jgi:4'-phosphopantetheinyl transferase
MYADTVELWHSTLSITAAEQQRYQRVLDHSERERAELQVHPLARHRVIQVYGRLRFILADYLGQDPAQIRIAKAAHGKPYLPDYPDWAFNLSHTADRLVIAVARHCQLGIDIEHCHPRRSLPALVNKCFAQLEADYWYALPESEKTRAFYQFWTRKEAFVKATGRGIALGLQQCVIDPAHQDGFLSVPEAYQPARDWRIVDFEMPVSKLSEPTFCGAVVADRPAHIVVQGS